MTAYKKRSMEIAFIFILLMIVVVDIVAAFLMLKPSDGAGDFRVIITEDGIACEHPRRKREYVRWDEVRRIWFLTTSEGPWLPDEWFLFDGIDGGCSFPTEAEGFQKVWGEIEARFPGFDYKPIIESG